MIHPKKIWAKEVLLLAAAGLATSALASRPTDYERTAVQPIMGVQARTTAVRHIDLNLRFDIAKRNASGSATLQMQMLRDAAQVQLDGAYLAISQVKDQAGNKLNYRYSSGKDSTADGALTIDFAKARKAGEELSITIDYQTEWVNDYDPNNLWGSNGNGLRFHAPNAVDPRRKKQVWSFGETGGNRHWFPAEHRIDSTATFDLRMTVEKPLMAITSGQLKTIIENANGTRTFHWYVSGPQAINRLGLVIGEYAEWSEQVDGVRLYAYAYPDEVQATKDSVVRLGDMLQFFSQRTGHRYPHSRYSQIFVQDLPWGTAHNMLAMQSENMVDDYNVHAEFLYLWDSLEAETLAHQWFGNLIRVRDWRDTWLARGLAHSFDGMYAEYKNGHDELLLWPLRNDHATYHADWGNGIDLPIAPSRLKASEIEPFASSNVPFTRAGLVLHMLRKHLGDARWEAGIKHYVKQYAARSASTQDFRLAMEEATGEDLVWFFDQWVHKGGHPVFDVKRTFDAAAKQLKVTVQQSRAKKQEPKNLPTGTSVGTHPTNDLYQGFAEIDIDNKVHRVWLDAKATNEFTIAHAQAPKFVHFDRHGTWIKELRYEKGAQELIDQLVGTDDAWGRQWAMAELVTAYKRAETTAATKAQIVEAFRQVIGGTSYWRNRSIAMTTLRSLLSPTFPALDAPAAELNSQLRETLQTVIARDAAWPKAAAIALLGTTRDPQYAPLYIRQLRDTSDRVINAAVNALGRSKSPLAFDELVKLVDHPSWKNQSFISALNGLGALGDARGGDFAAKALANVSDSRWTLATPVWDYPFAAADALVALKQTARGYDIVSPRLDQAMKLGNVYDIFYQLQLLTRLGDKRALTVFPQLREQFNLDDNAKKAIDDAFEKLGGSKQ